MPNAHYERYKETMTAYRVANRDEINRKARAKRLERRQQAIVYLGGNCVSCGATDSLEFDHILPPSKEFKVARILNLRWDKLVKELDKCQLLCHDCHVSKSKIEQVKYGWYRPR